MDSSVLASLKWDCGCVDIWSVGGAIHDLELRATNGEVIRPLAEALWRGSASSHVDPAHLANLGGEWPCVPFGSTRNDPAHHGFGTDNSWTLDYVDNKQAELHIDYPTDHVVERVSRRIEVAAGQPAVHLSLEVTVRRDCVLPIGFHPIFNLEPGTQILPSRYLEAEVFPRVFEPGVSILKPGCISMFGEVLSDLSGAERRPLENPAEYREELIQLWHSDGRVFVAQPDTSIRTLLKWNAAHFPHLLVWISNGGRAAEPWNGRFRGIGLEPINSYFDIDDQAPIERGPTGLRMLRSQAFQTQYSISLVC